MADYEELVELGFEGVDKLANSKYHDRVYDRLPAWKKKQKQQQNQATQNRRKPHNGHEPSTNDRPRSVSPTARSVNFAANDNMSSYAPSYPTSYAPSGRHGHHRDEGRDDYRDDRAPRYVPDEQAYYANSNPGTIVMRDNETLGGQTGYGANPRAPSPPPGYGGGYSVQGTELERGRPAPSRMRSSSWSPPRNERYNGEDDSRRRRRSRSRKRSRSGSREGMDKQRIAATLIGGLMGGLAGNQLRKGQKFDTAATIGGAVLGGIASREIADRIGHKKEDKREKRHGEQEAWESRYGDGGRDDDGRRSRDDRDSRSRRDYY